MNLRHELFFSFCAANNLTNFKNKGEENNLYIIFFISTKIKSNTMTNALQKKKLTYIKQVGWSLYYMWTRFLLFLKKTQK